MKFTIDIPPEIHFGRKCRMELIAHLPPNGALLFICGRHSVQRIEKEMLPLLKKRKVFIRAVFSGEPRLDEIDQLLDFARSEQISAIIGWGGGSAMDGAKAVAALYGEQLPAAEYFYNRAAAGERKVFFAALPTTAGTGAEVTANSVLTDPETGIKQSLRCPGMSADAVFVDPELVEECPQSVMAASGFDALTQAVESFISVKADALTSAIARCAVKDIFLNLEKACSKDPVAVDAVTLGAMNAGIALSKSGLGAVHGIGHPLGSVLMIPHGICCAILLPEVLRFNKIAVEDKLQELAVLLGFADAENLIREIEDLRKKLAVPFDLKKYCLTDEHKTFIVQNSRSGSMKCNPRQMLDEDIKNLLEKLK